MIKGFVYRCGTRIKDFGERMGHKKIPVLRRLCDRVINLGLAIKEAMSNYPIGDLR